MTPLAVMRALVAGMALSALLFAGWLLWTGQKAKLQLVDVQAELAASEAENARARERAARSLAAAQTALAEERQRAEAALSLLEAIDTAAVIPGQDGDVAPVLLDTLKRLP